MSFSLNDAAERPKSTGVQYQKVGIYENIRITEGVLLKTSRNQIDYMELRTTGENGELGRSTKMYFGTEVKEGNKTSGWGMTARNIKDLIKATHNVDDATAKTMFGEPSSKEDVISKISSLLVGRPFRGKFKGEEDAKGNIWVSLDTVESMNVPRSASNLRFSEERDVKKYQNPNKETGAVKETVDANDDLPF